MQKIVPCLWFDTNAEEAVAFYTKVFNGGEILATTYYPEAGKEIHGMDAGTILTLDFQIEGFRFTALNGGARFKVTPALSFMVNFDPSREEGAEDRLNTVWEQLSEGGEVLMPLQAYPFSKRYGWIQDKFGVSWQLILSDPEGEERPVIVPSLLFVGDVVGRAQEAIDLYTAVFKNSRKGIAAPYTQEHEGEKPGTLMFADFMLEGQWFAAMDSAQSHAFTFNEAVSLMVMCKDQAEIDDLWEKLSFVPEAEQCGWIKDKFGVSWQITPEGMEVMLNDPDKEKANKAMEAMLQMKKIDIAELQKAFNS